uniref:Uncharacterized protein n=1 Tax=uncultured marine bacterium EB0_39H12 TaxID=415437 RepID=A4GHZ5_9BACT|nr:hypothetical protein MBMO_EB0-39H12.0082 [uncultured marine bacterium EB0_39H12]
MNEMDIWNYMQNAVNTGATQGIGIAILIGLGLWISGAMYNSTDKNIIGKITASIFVLSVAMFYLFNGALVEWNVNQVAAGLTYLKETTEGISPGGQAIIDANDPGAPFSLVPNLFSGLFLLSVLIMQLSGIWMTKKS